MSNEIIEQTSERASSISIITNDNYMDRVMTLAKMMASSKVTVPKHLQGSEGDCAAIIMQSMNWGLDPFVVAQKTHMVNGTLGYEAQLVNAVVQSSNAIKSSFNYEYKDEGGSGATAYVSCRVGAVLNGQKDITWGEWLASASVTTKNSPLWKTNVKQQMAYLQVKNWARMYCPGAILGVYSAEELEDTPIEKSVEGETLKNPLPENIYLTDAEFEKGITKFKSKIASGDKTPADLIAWQDAKQPQALLTAIQKQTIESWAPTVQDAVLVEDAKVDDGFLSDYIEGDK